MQLTLSSDTFRDIVPDYSTGFSSASNEAAAAGFASMIGDYDGQIDMDYVVPGQDSMLANAARTLAPMRQFRSLSNAPLSSILQLNSMSKFQETTELLGDIFSTYGIELTELELLIFQSCFNTNTSFGDHTLNIPGVISSTPVLPNDDPVANATQVDTITTTIFNKIKSAVDVYVQQNDFVDLSTIFKKQYEKKSYVEPVNGDAVDTNFEPSFTNVPFSKKFTNATSAGMMTFMREKIRSVVSMAWKIQKVVNLNETGDTLKKQTFVIANLFGLHYNLALVACTASNISIWGFIARYMVENFYMYRAINDGMLVLEDRQLFLMRANDDSDQMQLEFQSSTAIMNGPMVSSFPNVQYEKNFELDLDNRCYYMVTTLKNINFIYENQELEVDPTFANDLQAFELESIEGSRLYSYTKDASGNKNALVCSDVRIIVNYNNDDRVLSAVDLNGEGWLDVTSVAQKALSAVQIGNMKVANKKLGVGLGIAAVTLGSVITDQLKETLIHFKKFENPVLKVETYVKLLTSSNCLNYFVGYDLSGNTQIINKQFSLDFSKAIRSIDSSYSAGTTAMNNGILHFYNLGVAKMTANVNTARTSAVSAAFDLVVDIGVMLMDHYFKAPVSGIVKDLVKQPFILSRKSRIISATKSKDSVLALIGHAKATYTNRQKFLTALFRGSAMITSGSSMTASWCAGTTNACLLSSDGTLTRKAYAYHDNNSKNKFFFNTSKLVVTTAGIPWFNATAVNDFIDGKIAQYYTMARNDNTVPWEDIPAWALPRLKEQYMPSLMDIKLMSTSSDTNITTAYSNSILEKWMYIVADKFFTDFDNYVSTYTPTNPGDQPCTVNVQYGMLSLNDNITYANEVVNSSYGYNTVEARFVSTFKMRRFQKDNTVVTPEQASNLSARIALINQKLAPWKRSLVSSTVVGWTWGWMGDTRPTVTNGIDYGIELGTIDNLSTLSIDEELYNTARTTDFAKFMTATATLKTDITELHNMIGDMSLNANTWRTWMTQWGMNKNVMTYSYMMNAYNNIKVNLTLIDTKLKKIITLDNTNTIIGGTNYEWSVLLKKIKTGAAQVTPTDTSRSIYLAPLRDKIITDYIPLLASIKNAIAYNTAISTTTHTNAFNALINKILSCTGMFTYNVLTTTLTTTPYKLSVPGTTLQSGLISTGHFYQLPIMIDDEVAKLTDGLQNEILRNVIGVGNSDTKLNTYDEIVAKNTLKFQYNQPATSNNINWNMNGGLFGGGGSMF